MYKHKPLLRQVLAKNTGDTDLAKIKKLLAEELSPQSEKMIRSHLYGKKSEIIPYIHDLIKDSANSEKPRTDLIFLLKYNRPEGLVALAELTSSADSRIQIEALHSLSRAYRNSLPYLDSFKSCLDSKEELSVRIACCKSLKNVIKYASSKRKLVSEKLLTNLVDCTKSNNEELVIHAIHNIATLQRDEEEKVKQEKLSEYLPLLQTGLHSDNKETRLTSIEVCEIMPKMLEPAVEDLISLMRNDPSLKIRSKAAEILAGNYHQREDVLLAAVKALGDDGKYASAWSSSRTPSQHAQSICYQNSEKAIPLLKPFLNEGQFRQKLLVASMMRIFELQKAGSVDPVLIEKSVDILMQGLESDDIIVVQNCIITLTRFKEKAARAVPLLLKYLGDQDKFLYTYTANQAGLTKEEMVASHLSGMGKTAIAAAPILEEIILNPQGRKPETLRIFYSTLKAISPETKVTDESFLFQEFINFSNKNWAGRKFTYRNKENTLIKTKLYSKLTHNKDEEVYTAKASINSVDQSTKKLTPIGTYGIRIWQNDGKVYLSEITDPKATLTFRVLFKSPFQFDLLPVRKKGEPESRVKTLFWDSLVKGGGTREVRNFNDDSDYEYWRHYKY